MRVEFAQEAAAQAFRSGHSSGNSGNGTMGSEVGVAGSSSGKGGKRKSPTKSKSKDDVAAEAATSTVAPVDSIGGGTMWLTEEQMVGFIESLCNAFPIPPSIFSSIP